MTWRARGMLCVRNLLIAQLTQSYHDAFSNMQAHGSLGRQKETSIWWSLQL